MPMITTITSLQNPKVKTAVKLRERHHRERLGLSIVEGIREVKAALEGGADLKEVFYYKSKMNGHADEELLERIRKKGANLYPVSLKVYERLAYGNRMEGIIALAQIPKRKLEELELGNASLWIVVEGIEKPGNLGALFRSADAAGITGVILCDAVTDSLNPNAIRGSLGTVFTVPFADASSSSDTIHWLRQKKIQIIATSPQAKLTYTDIDYTRPSAIILGSEQLGLTDVWLDSADVLVRIPMHGKANSLNLAMSATIMAFEAVRQRDEN